METQIQREKKYNESLASVKKKVHGHEFVNDGDYQNIM